MYQAGYGSPGTSISHSAGGRSSVITTWVAPNCLARAALRSKASRSEAARHQGATAIHAKMAKQHVFIAPSVTQPVPERKQRVVIPVTGVPGHLRHRARPGEREFPRGPKVAKEHVRDSFALGTRQPGGHHGIGFVQHAAEDHGAAG